MFTSEVDEDFILKWLLGAILVGRTWSVFYCEVEVGQFCYRTVTSCVQFRSSQYIGQRIVICVDCKVRSIVQLISELFSYGPFESQKLKLTGVKMILSFRCSQCTRSIGNHPQLTILLLIECCSETLFRRVSVRNKWLGIIRVSHHRWVTNRIDKLI